MPSNELRHYGVPGMKWGQRRASSAVDSAKSRYSNLSGGQKTAIRVGGKVAVGAAIAAGGLAAGRVLGKKGMYTLDQVNDQAADQAFKVGKAFFNSSGPYLNEMLSNTVGHIREGHRYAS